MGPDWPLRDCGGVKDKQGATEACGAHKRAVAVVDFLARGYEGLPRGRCGTTGPTCPPNDHTAPFPTIDSAWLVVLRRCLVPRRISQSQVDLLG